MNSSSMIRKRKYIRISTVLPVEFFVIDGEGKRLTPWLQGFTRDIAKGGIRIVINDLWWGFWDKFNFRNSELFVKVNLPFKKKSISARAKVAWSGTCKFKEYNQYFAGIEFLELDEKESGMLFNYAVLKKTMLPAAVSFLSILLIVLGVSFGKTQELVKEKRRVVKEYVNLLDRVSNLEKTLDDGRKNGLFFEQRQRQLQEKIGSLEKEISRWQEKYEQSTQNQPVPNEDKGVKEQNSRKEIIFRLKKELVSLRKENEYLKDKQKQVETVNLAVSKKVYQLQKTRGESLPNIARGMYEWIKNRQDLRSGLVLSYEGDKNLERVYFSYDQALAVIIFLLHKDYARAAKVLDFYLGKIKDGEDIYNSYYARDTVFEYTIHSGPNAWTGLCALNYMKETGDNKYLPLAEKVSSVLSQMMDKEGGIKGGPKENWYSTEHNLDAFAFFSMFYELTKEEKYLKEAEKTKEWISKYAYTSYGIPVKRGKGDSTIATDTYAWSITAFGPQMLSSINMNSCAILDFAVENCEVEVDFKRREGELRVKGFDFAKARHMSRGGVVSGEWTSQMVLSFEIMADYYKDKDVNKYNEYVEKAQFYFQELQKMLITSPSRVGRENPCLPYASLPGVDTGHGWRTPQGGRTGSLASTAYFLIAYFGFNPLKGEFLKVSLKDLYPMETSDKLSRDNLNREKYLSLKEL